MLIFHQQSIATTFIYIYIYIYIVIEQREYTKLQPYTSIYILPSA